MVGKWLVVLRSSGSEWSPVCSLKAPREVGLGVNGPSYEVVDQKPRHSRRLCFDRQYTTRGSRSSSVEPKSHSKQATP